MFTGRGTRGVEALGTFGLSHFIGTTRKLFHAFASQEGVVGFADTHLTAVVCADRVLAHTISTLGLGNGVFVALNNGLASVPHSSVSRSTDANLFADLVAVVAAFETTLALQLYQFLGGTLQNLFTAIVYPCEARLAGTNLLTLSIVFVVLLVAMGLITHSLAGFVG